MKDTSSLSLSDIHELPALILVGGLGTRLKSVIRDRPKPMALVAGRPFLEWLVMMLRSQGLTKIIFCTGHRADVIQDHFEDGSRYGVRLRYSHEMKPMGTGGAVRLALETEHAQRFFVLNGDSFLRGDLGELARYHHQKGAAATMLLVPMQDCRRYGSVEVGESGVVLSFAEKSLCAKAGVINAGAYCFDRHVFMSLPLNCPCSLETDILPGLTGNGLYALERPAPFLDIGTPDAFAVAQSFIPEHMGEFA